MYAASLQDDPDSELTVVRLTLQDIPPPQPFATGDEELDRSWEALRWSGTASYPATTYVVVRVAPAAGRQPLVPLVRPGIAPLTHLGGDDRPR